MTNPSLDQDGGWRPIATAPREGVFLIACRRPTNWNYTVETIRLNSRHTDQNRRYLLQYAIAWRPMPPEPPEEFYDLPRWGDPA